MEITVDELLNELSILRERTDLPTNEIMDYHRAKIVVDRVYQKMKEKYNTADDKKEKMDKIEKDFELIYSIYPKKVGKSKGFEYYCQWLKGRVITGRRKKLTNAEMWQAVDRYAKSVDGTDKQFIKDFSTFMNKSILDYVGDEYVGS